ncbi:MAG: HEAT repeat domain-containing protein [Proteobacteria bacterium]|nr:HEAT repeat domain-containing protein [Pseudomonadota bacterium]
MQVADNNQTSDPSSQCKAMVIHRLRDLLDAGDEVDKCNASRALGSIGAVEAIDDLVLRLRDEDIDVCIDAAEALGKLNALHVVPQLLESLEHDPDGELKTAIVKALGEIKSPASIPVLLQLAEHHPEDMIIDSNEDWDDWWDMQRQAVISLGQMKAEQATPVLQQLLSSDDVLDIEHDILKSLVSIGGEGEQIVIDQLKSASAQTRRRAAHELSFSNSSESLKALASAFTDSSEEVRLNALQALVDRKAGQYLRAIELLKKDRSEKVRQAAILAYNDLSLMVKSEIAGEKSTPIAVSQRLLKDPDADVRAAYLQSLQSTATKLDQDQLSDQILSALNDKNEKVILAAIPLLLKLSNPEQAQAQLIQLILRPKLSSQIITSCIDILAQLCRWNVKVSRIMTSLINHNDSSIRLTTLQALMSLEKNLDEVNLDQDTHSTPIDIVNQTLNGRVVLEIEVASIVDSANPGRLEPEAKITPEEQESSDDQAVEAMSTLESILQDNQQVEESLKQMNNEPAIDQDPDPSLDEYRDLVQDNIVRSEWLFDQKEDVSVASDVRRLAARILSGLPGHLSEEKSTRIINSLLSALNAEDCKLRTCAAESIAQIAIANPKTPGIEYAFGGLVTQFHNEQWDLKLACMKALAAIRNRAAIPILITALDHSRAALKIQAIQSITDLMLDGDELLKNAHVPELPPSLSEWFISLIDCLEDSESGVRYSAVKNIKRCLLHDEINQQQQLIDRAIEQIIKSAVSNQGGRTRDMALILKDIAPVQATEKLIQLLKDLTSSYERRFVIEMLEEMYRFTADQSASRH